MEVQLHSFLISKLLAVSSQLQVPAALLPEKEPTAPTENNAGQTSKPV